ISLAFGVVLAIAAANKLWFEFLQFTNSTDFNLLDPIFNKDVSFYILKLDFIKGLNEMFIGALIGFAIVIFVYYMLLLSLRRPQIFEEVPHYDENENNLHFINGAGGGNPFGDFAKVFGQGGRPKKTKKQLDKGNMSELLSLTSGHIKVLGVLFFLSMGLAFYLKQFDLLSTNSVGVVYGPGFTEINITLWVYRILMALSVAAAGGFVWGLQQRSIKKILIIPALMLAVSLLGALGATLVQSLVVSPDELNKEAQYLDNNINFTRNAYNLQDITVQSFAAKNILKKEDILNNTETISNIRINDYEPAEKFYNQTQSIRLYYKFFDVDVDRYMVNNEYTQTFLSAREIDESKTTEQWLTQHLKYTHGYGITLSRVDKVTESGQPDMLIDSIPPVSEVEEIQITRPEIYFGEATNSYIVVNTDEKEFDYPSGDNNVYTIYDGTAGIKLNFINRLLFAIREQSLKLLVSTNINKDSKIVINRKINERVEKIAPFLEYEQDPYIVTVDGKLYWFIDAYTTSNNYPYSEPYAEQTSINYVRNSIKVVIDAYNGDVSYYIVDDKDPIAQTLANIYPDLFKSYEEMPESLRAHIRYPDTLLAIQSQVYAKYHMTDVNVFYQNEDGWSIATEIYGTEEALMTPKYYIMKLPGEEKAEFISSVPYTPSGKYNMTALFVARSDAPNYGDLILYQLPKDRIIYGPRQIEAQINQHTEIAQDFTLWSSAGSIYSRGNMFIIPIEDSIMYVEPIYLESANSSLPEVKRVIVYYNERIAYAATLAAALDQMFGSGTGDFLQGGPPSDTSVPITDSENSVLDFNTIILKANEAYNNAIKAQQNGNWASYGEYLNELGKYLKLLEQ
ncbi:MAG: UPF0182 family protein, partial [Clostridia bacterium]|nr:UPF0182 family protein [Clostridia bacterium]